MPLDLTDNKSTLVQVMVWCRQATNPYLSQCWPRFMSPYGVTRHQWVKYIRKTLVVAVQCYGHLPHMGLPMRLSAYLWSIYSIQGSMEFSWPVIVQCHNHLPIFHIWTKLAHGPKHISLKLGDGFPLFKVLWNCVDFWLCSIMTFAHLTHIGLPMVAHSTHMGTDL